MCAEHCRCCVQSPPALRCAQVCELFQLPPPPLPLSPPPVLYPWGRQIHPPTHMCWSCLYTLCLPPPSPPHSLSSPSAFERGKAFADSLQHTYNTFVFSTALQEALSSHGLEVSNHTFVRPAAAATAAGAGAAAGLHLGSSSSSNVQECVNVHAVLHSPRGDGKEALVLVTPINHQHFNTGR